MYLKNSKTIVSVLESVRFTINTKKICINSSAKNNFLSAKNGKRIRPKNSGSTCRTDASFLGWGGYDINSGQFAKEGGVMKNLASQLTI